MKTLLIFGFSIVLILISSAVLHGQKADGKVLILDGYHYSKVFAANRNYRIFLPPSYIPQSGKHYPVIYFFHGWTQRYFGGVGKGYSDYDKGHENEGDNIEKFVSDHEVIVVKIDGLNQFKVEPINLDAYNVSPNTTFRQFPDYFIEFVGYIDSHYRTIPDRNHRAVSGLSKGGFMTFWLAAKFPDWVSAACNFCGSTEFTVGLLDFPVRYAHADMYDNFKGISMRMHNGTRDRLRFYHQDMNRYLMNTVPQYQFKQYDASHITCGLGDMFDFIMESFQDPLPLPEKWDYIDVYPYFEVRDYEVETSRNRPGFTILENVNEDGFNLAVRSFLPDGQLMPEVTVRVKTAPFYHKNTEYRITNTDIRTMKSHQYSVKSDAFGRLLIETDGSSHQIGIENENKAPHLSMIDFKMENMAWAESGQVMELSIQLLNKGFGTSENIKVEISPISKGLDVVSGHGQVDQLEPLENKKINGIFKLRNNRKGYDIVKLQVVFTDGSGRSWREEFEVLVKDPADQLSNFIVADGKEFTVVKEAVDSVTEVVGVGNGDGIANPGEMIAILVKHEGKYLRTDAYTTNHYINPGNVNIRRADLWEVYDHIGGAFKYTLPLLDGSIPVGEVIPFYVEYWTPGDTSGQHIIHKGKVNIRVDGTDKTPPQVQWVQVLTDDRIEARIYDGSGVERVFLTLSPNEEKSTMRYVNWEETPPSFSVEMADDGQGGDAVEGDGVYSARIVERPSYFYNLSFELMDVAGNKAIHREKETIFLKDTRSR